MLIVGPSLSVIVPMAVPSRMEALKALLKVTVNVSSTSSLESLVIVTSAFTTVVPGLKLRMPKLTEV